MVQGLGLGRVPGGRPGSGPPPTTGAGTASPTAPTGAPAPRTHMAKVPQDPEQSFMETNVVQPLCEISLTTGTVAQGTLVSLRRTPGERGRGWEGVPAFRGPPAPLTASSCLPKRDLLQGPQASWVIMGS